MFAHHGVTGKKWKTAIFTAFDTLMVFLLTWLWGIMTHDSDWYNGLHHYEQSFWYTVYITAIFMIYYYAFELSWKKIKRDI